MKTLCVFSIFFFVCVCFASKTSKRQLCFGVMFTKDDVEEEEEEDVQPPPSEVTEHD